MTRPPDRDRALDRLLRIALADPLHPTTSACLDAEQLAAWSDGTLAPEEAVRVEHHLSTCARCQALGAAFARTEPAAVPGASFWRRWPARWLVPVTATAAIVLAWVLVPREFRSAIVDQAPERVEAPRSDDPAVVPPPATARDEVRETPPAATGNALRKAAPATERDDARGAVPKAADGADQRLADGLEARAGESQALRREAAPQTAAPSPVSPPASADRAASAGAPAASAPPPPRPSTVFNFTAGPPAEILSPDGLHRWRILAAGDRVERTIDGGRSWLEVSIPPGASVRGGFAPSPLVCWLVGSRGTVLRTVNGIRFETVPPAGAADLMSITAADDQRATVTDVGGRRLATTDGGRNWQIQ